LVLVVLGLIAGITMPEERFIPVALYVLALPIIGAALGNVPTIGAQLGAVATGLALVAAGSLASAIAVRLYGLVKDDLMALAK
jgi:phosphotransferase system  glucose/maltose/N-acetylglucosamine-specific IIC component